MSRRLRTVVALVSILVVGGFGQASLAQASLGLEVPERVVAGDSVQVEVNGAGDEAIVTITSSYGTSVRPVETVNGAGSFLWQPEVAGVTTVTLISGALHRSANVEVVPDPDPVVSSATAAPERVFVGSGRPVTVVAFVGDRYGNPAEDGLGVDLWLEYPDGGRRHLEVSTAVGLAVGAFEVGVADGIAEAWAGAGTTTASARVEILPARPAPFALSPRGAVPPADGRSRLVISTEPLVDGLGNVIRDGTAGVVVVTNPDSSSELVPARVVAGRITVEIKAPSAPGRRVYVARLSGVSSLPLVLDFEVAG